jgi:beta-N-acetylhexosaminidase
MKQPGALGPVVLDIAGTQLTDDDRRRLRHPLVGMVILFTRNFTDPAQLAQLCREIHAVRDPALLIAVDHEGGRVQRFRAGFTPIPPMAALGRRWDSDVLDACRAALATGFVLGAELRAQGVDLSFTPVLDLEWGRSSVIGDRAFHADPRVVTLLAGQLNHGLALAGMSNCGKHFPGHGWAAADSHVAIPVDERSLDEILAADAAPYGWLGAGLDAVMPAHVVYPAVDALPAGFSPRWIQDILRARLGFTGAVFSDDLCMAGARVAGDVTAAAQAALAAGCDFVLVCNDAAAADQLLDRLQWRRTTAFDERLARLAPRTGAVAPAGVLQTAQYRAALHDLQALARVAQGKG